MDTIEKDKLRKKYLAKYKKQIVNVDDKHLPLAESIVDKLAFLEVTLADLQETIMKQGCVETYQNGKDQWGTKKSSSAEMYATLSKNYSTLTRQLNDLLPKQIEKVEDDGFDEFAGI